MDNNSIVSIIVPVYNAEKFLENCLESILKQSYTNLEVILVNDGSTDNSFAICEKYSNNDGRVKVINQQNSGPSVARNNGIKAASGKYIQFVDSDDYIEIDMTKKLVDEMNLGSQLVICGYKRITMNNGKTVNNSCIPTHVGAFNQFDFMSLFGKFFENSLISALWNKLYLTEIIKKFNINFNEDLHIGEDLMFNLDYIRKSQSISVINGQLYNYLIFNNDTSLTGNYKKEYFRNQQMLFQEIRNFLNDNKCYTESNQSSIERIFTTRVINCFGNLFHKNSGLTKEQQKQKINEIVSDPSVRNANKYFKNGSFQKRLVGIMINKHLVSNVYCFFKIKNCVRQVLPSLFKFFKKINDK